MNETENLLSYFTFKIFLDDHEQRLCNKKTRNTQLGASIGEIQE